jgi:hypothetical protein
MTRQQSKSLNKSWNGLNHYLFLICLSLTWVLMPWLQRWLQVLTISEKLCKKTFNLATCLKKKLIGRNPIKFSLSDSHTGRRLSSNRRFKISKLDLEWLISTQPRGNTFHLVLEEQLLEKLQSKLWFCSMNNFYKELTSMVIAKCIEELLLILKTWLTWRRSSRSNFRKTQITSANSLKSILRTQIKSFLHFKLSQITLRIVKMSLKFHKRPTKIKETNAKENRPMPNKPIMV